MTGKIDILISLFIFIWSFINNRIKDPLFMQYLIKLYTNWLFMIYAYIEVDYPYLKVWY